MNVRKMVEELLTAVKPEYLQGLGSIVLSCQTGLPRKRQRKKYLSRGRKIPVSDVLGYYSRGWQGRPAYIELYVDKILSQAPGLTLYVPMARFVLIAGTLYHELGHHLHQTKFPQYKEKEDVAEEWRKKLTKIALRKRYRHVMPLLKLYRTLISWIAMRNRRR
jgi:hypothetical protein